MTFLPGQFFFVVIGHIVMALTHRDALRSIFKAGSVEAGPSATPRDGFKRAFGRTEALMATPVPSG